MLKSEGIFVQKWQDDKHNLCCNNNPSLSKHDNSDLNQISDFIPRPP